MGTTARPDPDVTTELLIGAIYFRLAFGGALDREFGEKVVDALLPKRSATRARVATTRSASTPTPES